MFRLKLFLLLAVVLLIGLGLVVPAIMDKAQAGPGRLRPTLAPTPTFGPPPLIESQSYPELSKPLKTERDVLKHLQKIDEKITQWEKPWNLDTTQAEPKRITIEWYPDRSFNGEYFGPGAENGPVWVITIRGNVKLIDSDNLTYNGISYIIGQKTGNLLGYDTSTVVK